MATIAESFQDERDPLALPYQVAAHVLDYVPPRELVSVCMLVCRRWRAFLTDPTVWKVRMRRGGNYSPELDAITRAEWPKLCLHTLYQPNLIKSLDPEQQTLSFAHWKWCSVNWDHFKLSTNKSQTREDERYRSHYWEIERCINPDVDKELLAENGGCVQNYVTSYQWGCREQVVCLADAAGLSNKIMDQVQPRIEVWEWFCARDDCGSVFCFRVELLSARKRIIKFHEETVKTEQWQGGRLGWRKLQHTFRDYGHGVRYLRFADAGKDTQYWAGHYGSKMAAAWARVRFSKEP